MVVNVAAPAASAAVAAPMTTPLVALRPALAQVPGQSPPTQKQVDFLCSLALQLNRDVAQVLAPVRTNAEATQRISELLRQLQQGRQ